MAGEWVELGRIGAPYGVRGWMHVQSHTDPPEGLLGYPVWALRRRGEPEDHGLIEGRLHGRGLVARLAGIESREAAALLNGAAVEVRRRELPPPGERQYYRADLVGFAVCNLEGVSLGTIAHFVDGAAGPLMVVRGEQEWWIPAVPQYLRKVEFAARTVSVDWPVEP